MSKTNLSGKALEEGIGEDSGEGFGKSKGIGGFPVDGRDSKGDLGGNLEELLREHLESDIICRIVEQFDVDAVRAMEMYYKSNLAQQVSAGAYGVQYLSAACLVDDLKENEPEIFR